MAMSLVSVPEQGGDLLIDPVDRRGAGGAAAVLAREVERVDGRRGRVGGVERPVRTERQRPDRLELRGPAAAVTTGCTAGA